MPKSAEQKRRNIMRMNRNREPRRKDAVLAFAAVACGAAYTGVPLLHAGGIPDWELTYEEPPCQVLEMNPPHIQAFLDRVAEERQASRDMGQ